MSGQAHQIFVDGLTRLAGRVGGAVLAGALERVLAPVAVGVDGRAGVGVRTVAAALTAAGHAVQTAGDIRVRVVAEVAKPEDVDALRGTADAPAVVVLNKADLSGFGTGGPLAAAQQRSTHLAALLGLPVDPMTALLAVAALDRSVVDAAVLDALRVLVHEPADLSSPEAFAGGEHPLPRADRCRLLNRLDVFGIAHCVLALRAGQAVDADGLRRTLRGVSGLDAVQARIDGVVAEVRYRRMLATVVDLAALAAHHPEVDAFLNADETVSARMAVAVDVMRGAGIQVADGGGADACLRRARHWQRYSSGPVGALHSACGADIVRGSMRSLAEPA